MYQEISSIRSFESRRLRTCCKIHKEETTTKVSELSKNKIIKPLQSPYNTSVFIVPKKPD